MKSTMIFYVAFYIYNFYCRPSLLSREILYKRKSFCIIYQDWWLLPQNANIFMTLKLLAAYDVGGVARKGKIETIISQSPTSSICVWFVLPRSHVLTSIQFKSMIKALAADVYRKDVCSASLHMCIFTFSWCKVPWQNTKQSLNRMTMNKKENNLKNRVFLHCLALAWFLEAMENVHIINKYSAQSNALEPHFWDEKNSWNCFCI